MDAQRVKIINIFKSIDGEAYHAGLPTIFLRTYGCNLRCAYNGQHCFAKDQSGKYPYVIRQDGTRVFMDEVQVGDTILTKDPSTAKICSTQVTAVMFHEADDVHRVRFGSVGDCNFNVTSDHPFYTDKGWVPVAQLFPGMRVARALPGEVMEYVVNEYVKDALLDYTSKLYDVFWKAHPGGSQWGEANTSYKEGLPHKYKHLMRAIAEGLAADYPLKDLWGTSKLVVHHLDGDHDNDELSNMVVLPKRVHDQLHARGNNFGKAQSSSHIAVTGNELRRKNKKHGNVVVNLETTSHTYLVECSIAHPHRAYGSSVLVHNCDTPESWSMEEYNKYYDHPLRELSPEDAVREIIELDPLIKHATITGGEPLLPENQEWMKQLTARLLAKGYEVDFETNGAVDLEGMDAWRSTLGPLAEKVHFIMDWKCPGSKMTSKMVASNLEVLKPQDVVKCVVCDGDFDEVLAVRARLYPEIPIYVSPAFGGVTMSSIPEFVVEHSDLNLRCQLQIHKYLYPVEQRDV